MDDHAVRRVREAARRQDTEATSITGDAGQLPDRSDREEAAEPGLARAREALRQHDGGEPPPA